MSLLSKVNWRIRKWQRAGKYPWVTRSWTYSTLTLRNLQDRMVIGRVETAIRTNAFPEDVDTAVNSVCDAPVGAGIRPMQLEPEFAEMVKRIQKKSPRLALEIGTARGGSLCLLCRFSAPDATIISVDLPFGRNGGGYPKWKEQYYRSFAKPGQTLHLLRANSHSPETFEHVKSLIGERRFDFMLIDGDHSYEGVKQDYERFSRLLAEDGIVALHDILPNLSDPSIDVHRFWDELEADRKVRTERITSYPEQKAFGIGLVQQG